MLRLLRMNSPAHVQRAPNHTPGTLDEVEMLEEQFEEKSGADTLQSQWAMPDQNENASYDPAMAGQMSSGEDPLMTEHPEMFDVSSEAKTSDDTSPYSEYEDPETQTSRDPAMESQFASESKNDGVLQDEMMPEDGVGEGVGGDTPVIDMDEEKVTPAEPVSTEQNFTPAEATTTTGTPTPAASSSTKPAAVNDPKTAASKATDDPAEAKEPAAVADESPAPAAGGDDLVKKELAEHDRWGKYGAPGSSERKWWVAKNVATGFGEGTVGGLVMGVGVHGLGKGVEWAFKKGAVLKMGKVVGEQALKHVPVPAVGPIVGGLLSSYNLVTRDWAGNWDNIKKGFSLEGKTGWEKTANLLQGISDVVDILSNVLNVVAGVAGAIAAGSWLLTVATAGALTPVAAAATSFAAAVSIITGVMDMVNGFVLQPAITACRAMDAIDMDADPASLEKAAKDIRSAASGPGAAMGAYVVSPGLKKAGEKYNELKKPSTTNQSNVPPTGTASQTPHVTVQPTPENVHLTQGDGTSAPAGTTNTPDAAGTAAPKPQTEAPSAQTTSETTTSQTTTTETSAPASQTPPPQVETAKPPAQTEAPAPKAQTETPAPAQTETAKPAETTAPKEPAQEAKSSTADDAAMKPDEKPPASRDEAQARQQETQKKRETLQKEIDAHEKTMKESVDRMQQTAKRESELDARIGELNKETNAAEQTKSQKLKEAEAADQKRYQAERDLQKARESNNQDAVAAAQSQIASHQEAASKARAEYEQAAAQEQKASAQIMALRQHKEQLLVDGRWDGIIFDQAAAERAKLLEQQALLDADLKTTQDTLDALNQQQAEPAASGQTPAEPPLAGAHGDESRRLAEQHEKLLEENQRLKDEKKQIEKEQKKKNADLDALEKRADENRQQLEANQQAMDANVGDQILHHYPNGMNPGQRIATDQMNTWSQRATSWNAATPKLMKPQESFNANNLGGSLASGIDSRLYPGETSENKDTTQEPPAMPQPETVNLSPAYSDPPATPEAIASLRDQADDLGKQHKQMKQIEQTEAEEQAKGEAQKAQAEEAVTQSKAMLDLNREHGQKTQAGSEAVKKQESENKKTEGAVEKYDEQADKFSTFQSVLGTVLGLEHLLDMLPDSVADYGRSLFGGAHKLNKNLAAMNSGMSQVAAAGPQASQEIADKNQRFTQTKQENASTNQQLQQNETGAQKLKAENEQKTTQAAQNKAEAQATDAEILDLKAEKQTKADELDAQMQMWAQQHRTEREQCVMNAANNAATNGFQVLETSY